MEMIMNVGEDDGSAGDSGGDGSSGGNSGNSGLIRSSQPQAGLCSTPAPPPPADAAGSSYAQPAAMTQQSRRSFAGYSMLQPSAGESGAASSNKETSWKSNVKKWQLETHETVSPRGVSKKHGTKKLLDVPACSLENRLKHGHGYGRPVDETDDSETSTSSYSSSCSSGSPTSSLAAPVQDANKPRWTSPPAKPAKAPAALTGKALKLMERAPLLRPLASLEKDSDMEPGRLLAEARNDMHVDVKTEIAKLCALSYPVIFTYVLEFLPELASMMLVGHMDSPWTKQYLDGVALSTMCMNLTGIGFGFGLATAMDTLCSQAYGAGKPKKLGIYLQSGLIVLGLTVIPVTLINWYTTGFLELMGQPHDVAVLAGRFSRLQLAGIPFLYVYELMKKVLQAQNVVLPMVYIAVLSNVVNIALGVYLTFYTSLGFDGAAIARTIANMVLPLSLIPFFLYNPHICREWWPGWQPAQAVRHLGAFLTLGIPGMFMMLLEWWSFEIMAAFVGLLPNGVVSIAVHSVLVNVSTMAFNFFLGISVASNVLVGNYVGSNQLEHAKMASTLGMLLSVSVSAVLAVMIIAGRAYVPEVFINDATSITLAAHALLFLMPYQMLDALNCVMQGVFRGTGRLMLGAYINLFSYFVIGLPVGVYLAFHMDMGVEGLWLGLTAGILFGCIVSTVKIWETDWNAMADAARVRTS